MIHRVLNATISTDEHPADVRAEIKNLASVFEIDEENTSTVVKQIITRLTTKGIKYYMKNYYNEKTQKDIIEIMFNKIILNKFAAEYQNITTYVANTTIINKNINNPDKHGRDMENGEKSSYLFLNNSDLMIAMFQYLDGVFKGDLVSCSLVNSHWFSFVYNPNSIYCFKDSTSMKKLIIQTKAISNNELRKNKRDSIYLRQWQRLIKVQIMHLGKSKGKISRKTRNRMLNKMFIDKLSMIKNIRVVNVNVHVKHCQIPWIIANSSEDKI